MQYHRKVFKVAAIALIAAGCAKESQPEPFMVQESTTNRWKQDQENVIFIPIALPKDKHPFPGKKKPEELSQEEITRAQREILELAPISIRIDSLIMRENDLATADREIRKLLASIKHHRFGHEIEQKAANKFLSFRLLDDETTPAKLEAIEYYTGLLIDNEHPDAEVMVRAFSKLDHMWSKEKMARSVRQTISHAREYLEKNPCKPCLEKTGISELMLDARQRKLSRMAAALPELERRQQNPGK